MDTRQTFGSIVGAGLPANAFHRNG